MWHGVMTMRRISPDLASARPSCGGLTRMRFGGWCAAAACAPRPPHSVPEIGVGHISLLDCSQRVFSLVRSACSCNTLRNDRNMMNESDSDISRVNCEGRGSDSWIIRSAMWARPRARNVEGRTSRNAKTTRETKIGGGRQAPNPHRKCMLFSNKISNFPRALSIAAPPRRARRGRRQARQDRAPRGRRARAACKGFAALRAGRRQQ